MKRHHLRTAAQLLLFVGTTTWMAVCDSAFAEEHVVASTEKAHSGKSAEALLLDGIESSRCQIKVTYVGEQKESVSGLFIAAKENSPDWVAFKSFRRSHVSYSNDDAKLFQTVSVSENEMRGLVASLGSWTGLESARHRRTRSDNLVFSLMEACPASKRMQGFELLLTRDELGLLLEKFAHVMEALGDSTAAAAVRAYR